MKRESERLNYCQMWITYPPTHILPKASLSCAFLTTKLSSRWDEVRRWDTCPDPTELRLIRCSTESTWNQGSKSNVLTPKTNWLTCWPKRASRVTSGTIFFVCLTSRVSRCSLAAISAIFFLIRSESRAPCQREVKKRLPVKVHSNQWFQWRRDPSTWCYAARWVRGRTFRTVWVFQSIRWMPMENKVNELVQGNLYGPPKAQKSNVLKWGDRKMVKIQILGNRVTRRNLRTLLVQGVLYGRRLQEQSFKNLKHTNHQYMTKIFHVLQKKLGMTVGYSTFSMEALKTKCVEMENVHAFVNGGSHSPWTE